MADTSNSPPWSKAEIETLRAHFPRSPFAQLEELLPGRAPSAIRAKAGKLEIRRARSRKPADERRRQKREYMARQWEQEPEKMRRRAREHHVLHREQRLRESKLRRDTRFFATRATKLRGITAKQLAALWKKQRGRCALMGEKLDTTAQVDHKLPVARGGLTELENLQWTTACANHAKRDLTDEEFRALCERVVIHARP
jgi:5-methylcytosine-specific restriction endonuclease McrA